MPKALFPRPGLPQSSFGRSGKYRESWLQLLLVGDRHPGNMFELQYGMGVLRPSGQSCPRSSVALPLGINGAEAVLAKRSFALSRRGHPDAARVGQFRPVQSSTARHALKGDSIVSAVSRNRMNRQRRADRERGDSTVARWDFISVLLTAKRMKSLWAGDGFFARTKRRRASSFNCPRAGQAPRPVDGRNLRFAKAAFTPILCPRASRAARLKLQKHA